MQATKEMQIAARAVAAENYHFRELLKSHLHRNDHDIDMLLVNMRDASPAPRRKPQVKTGFDHTRAGTTQSNLPSTIVVTSSCLEYRHITVHCDLSSNF